MNYFSKEDICRFKETFIIQKRERAILQLQALLSICSIKLMLLVAFFTKKKTHISHLLQIDWLAYKAQRHINIKGRFLSVLLITF